MIVFKNIINQFKPGCILIQESKLRNKGSLKLDGYQIFELNRIGMGGGLFTAIDENLSPVLIRPGQDNTEILVTQICIAGFNIRILNGYGPQEDSNKDDILNFWHQMEKEIIDAKDENCGIIIGFDANAKLGSSIIQGDPNVMSNNGLIFLNLVKRHNLTVANASDKCNGTITRHRSTINNVEEAVLDYFVFCERMEPFFNSMLIDEKRLHVLKKFVTTRGFVNHVESDHNIMVAKFSLKYQHRYPRVKREFFNFHNKEGLDMFAEFTNNTDQFSRCADDSKSTEENARVKSLY